MTITHLLLKPLENHVTRLSEIGHSEMHSTTKGKGPQVLEDRYLLKFLISIYKIA